MGDTLVIQMEGHLRKTIAVARAQKGWSWKDVSEALSKQGIDISSGHLATKHSRMTFRATELVMILHVLGVSSVEVPKLAETL